MKRFVRILAGSVALFGAAHANGIYLESDIRGERGTDPDFAENVPLTSLSWGIDTDGDRGGAGSLTCQLQDITAVKDVDGASVEFVEAIVTSKRIGNPAIIKLTRNLGYDSRNPDREFVILELIIEDAFLSRFESGASADDFSMAETFSIISRNARYFARSYEYNRNNGRLLRTNEFPIGCNQAP